jgi:hypothetical protein
MSVHLICPNGHRFTRPTVSFRRDGARCPKCEEVTWQREKVKVCPAAPGCPQTPECTGCAYDAPKTPHPMMAMQEVQTAQEVMGNVSEALAETLEAQLDPEEDAQAIAALEAQGHPHHCACRQVWGDGECECPQDQASTEAEEHLLDAEESPLLRDIYPVDPDLDDPDSPKHQGAI